MVMGEITIGDSDYQEKLANASGLVIFYKKLCPNCKALERMLEKFLASNPGIAYMRIDSEECPKAMRAYGVQRVPTLLVLKKGQVAARKVGLMNLREMTEFYRSA